MDSLTTERLVIRRFRPDDWEELYAYLSDPTVVRFEPYDPYTEEQCREEARRRGGDGAFLAVCLKEGRLIGNLYLKRREPEEDNTWELGYVFNTGEQGKGYAAESCRAALEHVFRCEGARRVVALCDPLNAPSWRLLERLRFRREGHFVKNVWFRKDGEGRPVWKDTYAYAMLAEEWTSSR